MSSNNKVIDKLTKQMINFKLNSDEINNINRITDNKLYKYLKYNINLDINDYNF